MTARRILTFLLPLVLGMAACAADTSHEAAETTAAPDAATATEAGGESVATELPLIDIPNALLIQDGILGGGQPDEAQLRQAADAGYRTIINTRGPDEAADFAFEEELVRSLGMEYVFLPVSGGDDVNADKARALAEILEQPDALPAMVHCRSGNRVGILFAAKAFVVDGVDAEAAMEFGTASGMRRVPEQLKSMLQDAGDH